MGPLSRLRGAGQGHELSGQIAASRAPPDHDAAKAQFRGALGLAEPRGMPPLVAHCHLGLGELYARIGTPLDARAHLNAAIDLYRSMEMTFWLPRVESALAAVAE